MHGARPRKPLDPWGTQRIPLGSSCDVQLVVGESYSGAPVYIPIHVRRAPQDGPAVFVSAALHGDEINGTGAIRQLIDDTSFQIVRGSLLLIPVLNIISFDRHARYLPDRRDLNRSFPGSSSGSLARRMARTIFDEIVARCDYGVDLHTAAVRRTNYPTVRGDLSQPVIRALAQSFGAEIIVDGKGPLGALRREACQAGCPTIIMEGGEVWKVEPTIVASCVRGVKNVLRHLKMLDGEAERPDYQVTIEKTKWVRAERGGFLKFHIKPGEVLERDQPIASNTNLLGHEKNLITAPFDGVVLGMTTLPAVSPGEPICHLGMLPKDTQPAQLRRWRSSGNGLEQRLVGALASNVLVVRPSQE